MSIAAPRPFLKERRSFDGRLSAFDDRLRAVDARMQGMQVSIDKMEAAIESLRAFVRDSDARMEQHIAILDARRAHQEEQFRLWQEKQDEQRAQWQANIEQQNKIREQERLRWSEEQRRLGEERKRDFREDLDRSLAEFRAEARSVKVVVISTGIASVLSIAAFNATVLSNMVVSFDSGKEMAMALAKGSEDLNRAQAKFEQTVRRNEELAAAHGIFLDKPMSTEVPTMSTTQSTTQSAVKPAAN